MTVTRSPGNQIRHRISRLEQLVRTAVAVSLMTVVGAGLLGTAPAFAQERASTALSTSTITPADAVLYAEVSLDAESAQLQAFDEILARLGSEDSLIEAIQDTATGSGDDLDLTGAEVAVAILPSALAAGADVSGELIDAATSGNVSSDLGAGASTADQGIVIVVRPHNITEAEASMARNIGADAKTETYLGVDILTSSSSDDSITTFAVVDNFLVAGSTVDDVRAVVDAAQALTKTLADLDGFTTTIGLLPAERVGLAFSNGPALLEAAEETGQDPALVAGITDAFATFTGYAGLAVLADEPGIRFETVLVPADGSTDAEAAGSAADLDIATRLPSDTAIFASGFDLGQSLVLNGLGLALVTAFAGISSPSFDDTEATPAPISIDEMYGSLGSMFGFNLKTEFIDQMTGPYGFGIWGLDSQDPADVHAVLVSGVADEATLGDTLGTVSFLIQAAAQGQASVTSRQLEGGSVNHIDIDSGAGAIGIDYGVVGGEFVLGIGDGAETVLAGPTDSLADSDTYTAALANLPDEFQSVYFVDIAQLANASQEMSDAGIGQNDLIDELVGNSSTAAGAEAFAAVTYVEDGYYFTSGIVTVP